MPIRPTAKLVFTTNALNPMHSRRHGARTCGSPPSIARPGRSTGHPARDVAGIPKGVGLHCLRHYFATLLIHNGASAETVQPALGHAPPTITLGTYVGEWPERTRRYTRSWTARSGMCSGCARRRPETVQIDALCSDRLAVVRELQSDV